jgi:biotin transport system substrate-specific component
MNAKGKPMSHATLASRFWPETSSLASQALLAIVGSMIVAVAAHISVLQLPVPITLQTMAVLAIGATFGARLGAATLALYAVEGAAGLPVFSPLADGYPGLMGPTGGYIIGFIFASGLVGYLVERGWGRSVGKLFLACVAGAVLIYVPGLLWLGSFIGAADAVAFGLYPFVWVDLVKAALVALGVPAVWSLVEKT